MRKAVAIILLLVSGLLYSQDNLSTRKLMREKKHPYTIGVELFQAGQYEEAEEYLKSAVVRSKEEANVYLGQIYEHWAVEKAEPAYYCKAVRCYELAASKKVAEAWYLLGNAWDRGICNGVDYEKAHQCYTRAVRMKPLPLAYLKLGDLYMYCRGVEKDIETAFEHFERASELGVKEARYNIAMLLYETDPSRTWQGMNFAGILKGLGEEGLAKAWYKLAEILHQGLVVEPDPALALKYYQWALAGGRHEAVYGIAALYLKNPELDPQGGRLVAALQACAEDGSAEAMRKLGEVYVNGERIEKNVSQALVWWQKAGRMGDAESLYFLGALYADGDLVELDLERAEEYLRKAIEAGSEKAAALLAELENK